MGRVIHAEARFMARRQSGHSLMLLLVGGLMAAAVYVMGSLLMLFLGLL